MTTTGCPHWSDHVFRKVPTGEEPQYQCVHCQMVVNGMWFEALPDQDRKVVV